MRKSALFLAGRALIPALAILLFSVGGCENTKGTDGGSGDAGAAACNGCGGGGTGCSGCMPACTGGQLCCAWSGGACLPTDGGGCAPNSGVKCVAPASGGVCPNQCYP